MSRYEKANEWLGMFDVISSAMYADGDFGLQAYLPYLLVPFHPLCRERAGNRVERDSTDWDASTLNYRALGLLTPIAHRISSSPAPMRIF